ncbi:MAG: CDP-glycerol glycerophosphotransferase family protein [Marinospirillum sp.]|uniref:CDP-glycerol glycerophosphotransferase family protein n=1 Tax=Marinospirillum sp. TaxID=2183934 RepID=UPI0019F37E04|nr:CDP-glycerol glycerophosphotransferase family protein [Marinospirillum sp.]MBE0508887.1 CDP-glycerol glycerophosphotransferase family protein [Marinospirillum sp.]
MKLNIWFDVPSLYYLPQYIPVYEELTSRGHSCSFLLYHQPDFQHLVSSYLEGEGKDLPVKIINKEVVNDFYAEKAHADWIIFGNDNFTDFDKLPKQTKTALLYHGIGVKACYYTPGLALYDVRFTEGRFRQEQLATMYPKSRFVETGFAKLDPLAALKKNCTQAFNLEQNGLNSEKPTLLYAPTFYPSSIELMDKNWPDHFDDCNIIIKPHFFTYTNKKYHKQRQLLERWSKFNNVYLTTPTEISLLPYMATANILISEASSALFEFAALDKPVVWLDYLKLRWSYRGPLRYRFEKRMDKTILPYTGVAAHVTKPGDLERVVRNELRNPCNYSEARKKTTEELIGKVDGEVSKRIVNYLEGQ